MYSLILLPGLACDDFLYREQLAALAAAGHSAQVSDLHFRHDTIEQMATALLTEHDGPLVLVGTSMGGMLALEAARQAPERMAGLAMLGSSARPDTPELIRVRSEACELFAAGRMDEVLRANVAFAFHPDAPGLSRLIADYLAMIRRAGAPALIRQNRAVMARRDQRPLLPTLRCPLLVVHGEGDLLALPEYGREVAAAAPGAQLIMLPRCGHMLTMERPEAVNDALLGWLGALG